MAGGDAYVPGVVGMPVQWSTVPYDSTGDGVPDMVRNNNNNNNKRAYAG
jgi:hypothetical protein